MSRAEGPLGGLALVAMSLTMLISACAAPADDTVAVAPATPPVASDPVAARLADITDLPEGFIQTGDREVGALEVSDDPDELATVTARGRVGGRERTFVADGSRDDGVVLVQVWLSMYRDPAGAAWAYAENVADTKSEALGAIAEIAVPPLGDESSGFALGQPGEFINGTLIVYLRSGTFCSGVLVAGRKVLLTPDLAIQIARRQAERLVPRFRAATPVWGTA